MLKFFVTMGCVSIGMVFMLMVVFLDIGMVKTANHWLDVAYFVFGALFLTGAIMIQGDGD